uniref:G-protein coupled receptors family 1 profile domain-containing protein n=1 Tax=Timema bartmani TaxID=61472 RepID=A0A7R9I5Y9_9NEOP|nr:unnamed protein product [Timema bartmani]
MSTVPILSFQWHSTSAATSLAIASCRRPSSNYAILNLTFVNYLTPVTITDVSCRRLDGLYQRSEDGRLEKDLYSSFTITGCHCHQSLGRHQSIHDHSCLHQSPSSSESFRSHRVTFSHGPPHTSGLRRSNTEKALTKKKRVLKMLFAVVLEFFICWTPLYVINTIALFDPNIVYYGLGYTAITFFQLLAYSSSCCNPITYCFMNSSFRKSFVNLFGCNKVVSKHKNDLGPSVSDVSLNMIETKWSVKKHYCVNRYL